MNGSYLHRVGFPFWLMLLTSVCEGGTAEGETPTDRPDIGVSGRTDTHFPLVQRTWNELLSETREARVTAPEAIVRARKFMAEGEYRKADEVFEKYFKHHPDDGWAGLERAEMVYRFIQRAKGLALLAEAARSQNLPVEMRSNIRVFIAKARFDGGNSTTARNIALEGLREDPLHPGLNQLLSDWSRRQEEQERYYHERHYRWRRHHLHSRRRHHITHHRHDRHRHPRSSGYHARH